MSPHMEAFLIALGATVLGLLFWFYPNGMMSLMCIGLISLFFWVMFTQL